MALPALEVAFLTTDGYRHNSSWRDSSWRDGSRHNGSRHDSERRGFRASPPLVFLSSPYSLQCLPPPSSPSPVGSFFRRPWSQYESIGTSERRYGRESLVGKRPHRMNQVRKQPLSLHGQLFAKQRLSKTWQEPVPVGPQIPGKFGPIRGFEKRLSYSKNGI